MGRPFPFQCSMVAGKSSTTEQHLDFIYLFNVYMYVCVIVCLRTTCWSSLSLLRISQILRHVSNHLLPTKTSHQHLLIN